MPFSFSLINGRFVRYRAPDVQASVVRERDLPAPGLGLAEAVRVANCPSGK